MGTKLWAVLLVLFTTLLTSSAQILWKKGSATLTFSIVALLTNYYIIGGLFLYFVGGIFLIISFRGGEVSVLYPIIAISYVWVSFFSIKFLGEAMNNFKWIGITLIIAGIISIGYGGRNITPALIKNKS